MARLICLTIFCLLFITTSVTALEFVSFLFLWKQLTDLLYLTFIEIINPFSSDFHLGYLRILPFPLRRIIIIYVHIFLLKILQHDSVYFCIFILWSFMWKHWRKRWLSFNLIHTFNSSQCQLDLLTLQCIRDYQPCVPSDGLKGNCCSGVCLSRDGIMGTCGYSRSYAESDYNSYWLLTYITCGFHVSIHLSMNIMYV